MKRNDIQVNSENQILWKGFCKRVILQGFAALLDSLLMDSTRRSQPLWQPVYIHDVRDKFGEVIRPFPRASSGPPVFSVIIPLHETEITYGYHLYKDRSELSPLDRKLVIYIWKVVSQQNKPTVGQLGSTGPCFVLGRQLP